MARVGWETSPIGHKDPGQGNRSQGHKSKGLKEQAHRINIFVRNFRTWIWNISFYVDRF